MRKQIMMIPLLLLFFLIGACSETEPVTQNDYKEEETAVNEETNQKQEEEQNEENKEEINNKDKAELQPLTVSYIDADQADATLFQFSDGKEEFNILYDVGDWIGNQVFFFLQNKNIDYIDLIIISHPHADHIGQLKQIVNNIDVGEVWMSGNTTNTEVFQSAMEAVLASDIDYVEPRAGEVFDIGPLELSVLHPADLTGGLNEDSLSIRFTYGNISFLFTGDAYKKQERLILQRTDAIQADFLQLGHHGSNTSSDESFIDAVNPQYAIYSAGLGNTYGHPNKEIIQLMKEKGITLYGTDVNGTITVKTDGINYKVSTEKDGKVTEGQEVSGQQNKNKQETAPPETEKPMKDCIDINEASKEQLIEIIHIGEARADELISMRPFQSVDDLKKVKGIGDARLKDIKEQGKACVGGE